MPGDRENNLLAKILRRLNGIASPGDTDAQLLAKILAQFAGGGGGGSSTFIGLTDVPASFAGAAGKEVFVNSGETALEFVGPYFTKVGTAYLGGDQTGDARGAQATDVQSGRSDPSHVASGLQSSAFGYDNTASGVYSSAFGYKNTASGPYSQCVGWANSGSGYYSCAFGYDCHVSGAYGSVAFGYACSASGANAAAFGCSSEASGLNSFALGRVCKSIADNSTAIGANAITRVEFTTNICGPIINSKDVSNVVDTIFTQNGGVEVVLMWPEVDLKTATDYIATVPAGAHFYPNECGVIITSSAAVIAQATVRFGISGTPAKLLAAAITTTAANQFDRQRYQTLLSGAGEVTLSAGVTIGATATTLLGRPYIKGIFVEDQ